MVEGLGDLGASLGLAAMGSALGTGTAGMAALGAWKKCFIQNRPAPFILIAFVGAPLSQTIYGMILRTGGGISLATHLRCRRRAGDGAFLVDAG